MSKVPLVIIGQGEYATKVFARDADEPDALRDGPRAERERQADAQAALLIETLREFAGECHATVRPRFWRALWLECQRHLPKRAQHRL